jgi:hypothetical protein
MHKKNIILLIPLLLSFSSCSLIDKNDDFLFDIRIKEGRYNYTTSFSIRNITIDNIELLFDRKISLSNPCIDNELIDYSYNKEDRFKWNFLFNLSIQGEKYYYHAENIEYSKNQKNVYTLKNVTCSAYSSLSFSEIKLNLVNTNDDEYAEEIKISFSEYENDISLINTSIKHKVEFKGLVDLFDYTKTKSLIDYYYDFEEVRIVLKFPPGREVPYIVDQDGNRLDYFYKTIYGYEFFYDMPDKDVILNIMI